MTGIFSALLSTVLVIAGIFIILTAIKTWLREKSRIPARRQVIFITAGIALLAIGIGLYLFPVREIRFGSSSPPTILGVTIRKGQENGGLVYYQEINFYDEDGDVDSAHWELVDLSDPAQRQFIEIPEGTVDAPPELQRIRTTFTQIWHCEGHIYAATLAVTLIDEDGNRSAPVRYTIDCN